MTMVASVQSSLSHTEQRAAFAQTLAECSETNLRIRIARTPAEFAGAIEVRFAAYSEKLAGLAGDVAAQEDLDGDANPIILIAEDVRTGSIVATGRLNYGPMVFEILKDLGLPAEFKRERLGYVSRMAAIGSPRQKRTARALLLKAGFQICLALQASRILMLVGKVRAKLYLPWGFTPIIGEEEMLRPGLTNGRPVMLLGLRTYALERQLLSSDPVLYQFLFNSFHDSIQVFGSLASRSSRGEERRGLN